ncbi:chlorophyll a/b-binding protein domain-containing protein, partial [Ochromonadaceae sp. CCMP2298]
TSPLGFFDPLGLSRDVSEKRLKLWREAEIKHGRLAMLAAMGILVQERFNPLFGGRILGAGIYHFQQVNSVWPAFFLVILASIAFTEMYTILRGWESP